ncbi:hypothetical protein PHYPSEUDO_009382 [Phytophthora pseudosyringae]|uniref:Uncharacterized protein n=1 Tax=Phytophthora pseudosyringae TaxID=221518 RepID=A0A8T1WAW7_9STRA|nr:hypothetical protein PHYPSEUDO_009382 [Phytophthora pseudosyringae]
MSKKNSVAAHWPMEIYDYERKAITDAAVGGVDLRKGCWIHCKWCNSTLKTTSFSLATWRAHQKVKAHRIQAHELLGSGSHPQFVSCSSQSSVYSSTSSLPDTQKTFLGIQSSQDHESLVRVCRDLHQNRQHQARYERDVTSVINAMTSLVTDQQSDLNTLQLEVNDMTREIEGLKEQVGVLRRNGNQQKNVRAPQKVVVAASQNTSQRIPASRMLTVKAQSTRNNEERFKIPHKAASTKKTNKRNSMTEMDVFEKRFRLT